jgi:capsule biosynthesis phosphatase
MVKRIIVDIDDTLTINESSSEYSSKLPNEDLIKKLKKFRLLGYEIILHTARNMKTYGGDLSKINKVTLPILLKWLEDNNVEFDGIIMGKPWCGELGFYIDDKAIRPDEFLKMSESEIHKLTGNLK